MVAFQQQRIPRKRVSCDMPVMVPRPIEPTQPYNVFLCPTPHASYLAPTPTYKPVHSPQPCRTLLARVPRRILTPSFPSDSRSPSPPHTIVPQVSSRHPSKMMHLQTVQAALIAPLTGCDTRKAISWLPWLPVLAQARKIAANKAAGEGRRKAQRGRRPPPPGISDPAEEMMQTMTCSSAKPNEQADS